MKLLNITDAEKNQKVIEFSVDKATFDAAVDKVYKKNVAKLNIPGFRRGKAPKSIIEKCMARASSMKTLSTIFFPKHTLLHSKNPSLTL
ncbi:MAG: trigger factor family protein [Clostridia bacterium]|nr:trigger factor family protein [Clostridia bacterium]